LAQVFYTQDVLPLVSQHCLSTEGRDAVSLQQPSTFSTIVSVIACPFICLSQVYQGCKM